MGGKRKVEWKKRMEIGRKKRGGRDTGRQREIKRGGIQKVSQELLSQS